MPCFHADNVDLLLFFVSFFSYYSYEYLRGFIHPLHRATFLKDRQFIFLFYCSLHSLFRVLYLDCTVDLRQIEYLNAAETQLTCHKNCSNIDGNDRDEIGIQKCTIISSDSAWGRNELSLNYTKKCWKDISTNLTYDRAIGKWQTTPTRYVTINMRRYHNNQIPLNFKRNKDSCFRAIPVYFVWPHFGRKICRISIPIFHYEKTLFQTDACHQID